jgi:hypothetical protein
MRDAQHIEDILSRLMPPGLTAEGQRGIEDMIDDLAAADGTRNGKRHLPFYIGGIAAALAAGFFAIHTINRDLPRIAEHIAIESSEEFTVVSESDRIEDMIDEGLSDTPDGSAMRTLRLRVVGESQLLDETTGIVMNISQPREEILLMPVSAF